MATPFEASVRVTTADLIGKIGSQVIEKDLCGKCCAMAILLPKAPVMSPRRRYQQEPVLRHLPKLYPPDGKVPDRVPTETVRQRVIAELAHENEELIRQGEPAMAAPSWETVHRALGRDKQRPN